MPVNALGVVLLAVASIVVIYLSNKLFDLLNGHLERLQGKLDVLQVQLSEQTILLEMLIRKLS